MVRRKKKEEETEPPVSPDVTPETAGTEPAAPEPAAAAQETSPVAATSEAAAPAAVKTEPARSGRGNRVQKVGIVSSDKMQKTVVVRVDRQVLHMKYRRYVRRTTKFKAHDELGATIGDRVRIVETRPLSARKRWRVVEIVQKAAK